ncbi:MAG: YaaR family protein [Clostridiaceae bacterium]|jgi:uncharacterized protein YaaR (DUF327 family)|nr:YaaR family protein [Clostridiaceae bacterium]
MGIKINGSNRQTGNLKGTIKTENTRIGSSNKSSFNSHLKRQTSQNQDEILQNMASEIIKQGERLSEKVDISELKAYKRMISEFLEEAIRSFARFSRESFMDRRGRHRLYSIVKKVNSELEELTKEVLKKEKDHLKIVGKIEDIRGLILDIII